MNTLRRAITITVQRKRLLSIIQQQHASYSYSTTTRTNTSRALKSSKPKPKPKPSQPPPEINQSSLNEDVLKEPVIWPKPSEIPWQSKVVNSVNLIGRVKIPVQFEASEDGKSWAGTIISQDDDRDDDCEPSSSLTSFW